MTQKISKPLLEKAVGLTSIHQVATALGKCEKTVKRYLSGCTPMKRVEETALEVYLGRLQPTGLPKCDYTFIDLFAGIGGLRLGFERNRAWQGRCIFTSEYNAYSQKTYLANFREDGHPIYGDIRNLTADPDEMRKLESLKFDLLLAGFPCQPFSIAGVSKKNALGRAHGFECKDQGNLFFDIVAILKKCRPAGFLLENVKNLRSHDGGKTFRVIMETLAELGYNPKSDVIDARYFVPQHRERTFIVGFRDGYDGFDWADVRKKMPKKGPCLGSILHGVNGNRFKEDAYTDANGEPLSKYTLTPKLWAYLQNYAAKHKAKGNGFGFGLFGHDDTTRTLSARYYKDGSEILVRQGDPGAEKNPRRLTPRECARLMGFDQGKRRFVIPVSDMQAYRQFGNAVVVPVVQAVAKAMLPHLMKVKLITENR